MCAAFPKVRLFVMTIQGCNDIWLVLNLKIIQCTCPLFYFENPAVLFHNIRSHDLPNPHILSHLCYWYDPVRMLTVLTKANSVAAYIHSAIASKHD